MTYYYHMDTLQKAVKASGGTSALARVLGINSQAVSQWTAAPAERTLSIAAATGWKITPHDLRPDLYPHPLDGLPNRETA